MQYLLMCSFDEAQWAKSPDGERGRIMGEYGKLIHELKTSGRLLAGAKLGGYHLIECKDRDEAVSIALRIPTAPGGWIEVRPLLRLE